MTRHSFRCVASVFATCVLVTGVLAAEPTEGSIAKRGEYLFRAGGCAGCHTDVKNDGGYLAGGRAFDTPFGRFYSPNITSDPTHGIGAWSQANFVRAMREGVDPKGRHYYPVFPYPSFTGMVDDDLGALYAYFMATRPVAQPNREHDLPWYMRFRIVNWLWKLLYLKAGPFEPDPSRSASWNRGAYLATAVAHCGECHTPRNAFGAPDRNLELAGTTSGPDGDVVPNITPDPATGIGKWSAAEVAEYLGTGEITDGPSAMGAMADVISDGLQYLRRDDLDAIAEYVMSRPERRRDAVAKAR